MRTWTFGKRVTAGFAGVLTVVLASRTRSRQNRHRHRARSAGRNRRVGL